MANTQKLLVFANFDAMELFSMDPSPDAAAFREIADGLNAEIQPAMTSAERKKLKTMDMAEEFKEAAEGMMHKSVWLVFKQELDQEGVVDVIKTFAKAGLANTALLVEMPPQSTAPGLDFDF